MKGKELSSQSIFTFVQVAVHKILEPEGTFLALFQTYYVDELRVHLLGFSLPDDNLSDVCEKT